MATYTWVATVAPRLDLSIWTWQMWNLKWVEAWLRTSHSKRQCLVRMYIALKWFEYSLHWSMAAAMVPGQQIQPLDPERFSVVIEEFCWKGVAPTPEAERQILEHAAEVAHDFVRALEPEELRERMFRTWTYERPVHEINRYLFAEELLGPDAAEIRYGS